jgi:DNA-binding transcriptional LysR family regulator
LVTPRGHPLARPRGILPQDLVRYPLVNAAAELRETGLMAALERLGVTLDQPRRVEASYAHAIRRYVELGFGIALVGGLPGQRLPPNLHVRCMSRHFGRLGICLVWRRGAVPAPATRAFAETIQTMLRRPARQLRRAT